jgi:serine/threonine protein phosphatase 1
MAARLLVTSDSHGCYDQFCILLDRAKLTKEDTLIILGDFIDRGPKSKDLVQHLIDLQKEFPNTVVLKGNHEQMLLDCYDIPNNYQLYLCNGGGATFKSYGDVLIQEHIEWIRNLPVSYETETHFFAHAGVNPKYSLASQFENDLLWIRDQFLYSEKDFGKIVVHGHTPQLGEPEVKHNRINIDTAGVYGNKFTLYDLTNDIFYFEPGVSRVKDY